jgi:acid stress-induced BolA-like protein IbaG/YrbA
MNSSVMTPNVASRIRTGLPATVRVESDDTHFASLRWRPVCGLRPIARHQLIYKTLAAHGPGIHALSIDALTPEEAQRSG